MPQINIRNIYPEYWWAGMQKTELQIMIYGKGIGKYHVQLSNSTSIHITETIYPQNDNYILIYVDIKNAPPQSFLIDLMLNEAIVKSIPYELKERTERIVNSFSSSDVIYLLMPDRFASGTSDRQKKKMYRGMKENTWSQADMARHGGDIKGMTDHLDYLQELGVTAVWHTPVLENDMTDCSYHGYAITDYYNVDARLGTNEDYKHFVSEAHKRGIKVIKDIVFNHCGVESFLFYDRPDDSWFNYGSKYTQTGYRTESVCDIHASDIDKELTVKGWFVESMPDLNGKNKHVADFLTQASIWWIEYAGIDGYRQDTYPYNDFDMMKQWCGDIESQYPGFNIVGETWINHNVGVSIWQKDSKLAVPLNSMLPSVMDFPLMTLLNTIVDEETDEWFDGFAKLYSYIGQDAVYANVDNLMTFLANHDTNRFQSTKENARNITRYKQALTLLLTLRGIPQIYYGDEIGMYANKSVNDGALRQNFPGGWKEDKRNAFTREGRTKLQNQYFDFTKKMLNWRKGNIAVQHGKMTHHPVNNGVYVYSRTYRETTVTIMINGTNKPQLLELSHFSGVLPNNTAYDVISEKSIALKGTLKFKSRQIYVLEF